MKWLKRIALLIALLVIVYFLGPRPKVPNINTTLPTVSINLAKLEKEIDLKEKINTNIKPDNHARIVWTNPIKKEKTEYSVVYIHGWSASQAEGEPIHREFAKRYGCNLYLARLSGHGLEGEEGMSGISVEKMLDTAKEAIAIGKSLGKKVILMSCSTGSTLAMYVASGNPDIHALINYSPNIDIYDPNSSILVKPWGLQLAKLVNGGDSHIWEANDDVKKYWNTQYKLKAIVALKSLVNATMKESVFARIKQPFFMGYYYEDEENQDMVVSVARMLEMFGQLGTPDQSKRKIALPLTKAHGMCSKYFSKDLDSVRKATYGFAEEVLKLKKVSSVRPALNQSEAILQ